MDTYLNKKPKEDCKYGDKCYQTNEAHRQKYNHPESVIIVLDDPPSSSDPVDPDVQIVSTKDNGERKRKSSLDVIDDIHFPKKDAQRLWQRTDKEYALLFQNNKFIHSKFLVKMPRDFYEFWDFSTSLTKGNFEFSFEQFNFELVGPFDFMAGRFADDKHKSPGEYLRHWRFFYDPPEFQTIFIKKGTGIHYGYWRDDPKDNGDLLIARNDAETGCTFEFVATNTFAAFAYFLEKDFTPNKDNRDKLLKLRKTINEYVSVNKIERRPLHIDKTKRWKNVVAKTFHGAGIIVPVDKKSNIGYRPLKESDDHLKKILSIFDTEEDSEAAAASVMEQLQPTITASVIALDECDFGTNLELGIDLFCSGHEQLHAIIQSLLVPAYTLLERPQFLAIMKAHLDDRRKSFNLSILD